MWNFKSCLKRPTGILPNKTIRWKPQNMVQWKHFELEKQSVTYDQERNNIERHMARITRKEQHYLPKNPEKIPVTIGDKITHLDDISSNM